MKPFSRCSLKYDFLSVEKFYVESQFQDLCEFEAEVLTTRFATAEDFYAPE